MALATAQFRPLLATDSKNVLKRINLKWILQRAPMLLFATVSSYGVAHFLQLSGLPFPFDWLGGISFDIGFLGVIALADQQLEKTKLSIVTYYALNIVMSALAALFNVLSHADGIYANITAEDITAGVPFAIVGLVFALFYHSIMDKAMEKDAIAQRKATEEAERKQALEARAEEQRLELQLQRERYEAENPYMCVCGKRYPKNTGLSNHKRNCADYKASM